MCYVVRMNITQELKDKIDALPLKPGVYQFFDENKRLLYIGKATQLRSRVQSYFRDSTDLSNAKRFMVHKIRDLKMTVVDNEPEALLLETMLIKKHQPPYNVVMKDDKNFKYIHISDEQYPRITTPRKLPLSGRTGRYFGPYTSGYSITRTLRLLKSIFRYCETPPQQKRGKIVFPKRACLDHHMGRCVGPCADAVSAKEYQKIFDTIELFLKGEYKPIRDEVERQMGEASENEEFERAARLRDELYSIDRLMEEQKVISLRGENADYLSLARLDSLAAVNLFTVRRGMLFHQEVFVLKHTKGQSDEEIMQAFRDQYYAQTVTKPPKLYTNLETRRGRNKKMLAMGEVNADEALKKQRASFEKNEKMAVEGLKQLGKAIKIPADKLHRVEIYDISNFQGEYSVGSMVVFIDGKPEPSQYRKFKIKTVSGPDDFASLREVMNRRVRHLPKDHGNQKKDTVWPRPDLIIIDGGKGQLSASHGMLKAAKIDIPIISLAKQREEIFFPETSEPVLMPDESDGLYLIQRMRDEAHRFAIGFYRRRHLKELV